MKSDMAETAADKDALWNEAFDEGRESALLTFGEALGLPQDPPTMDEVILGLTAERKKTQTFFEQLAASINTPHVGDVYRDCVKSILLRAVEAGLYSEKP